MPRVRPLTRPDLPQVVDLFVHTFRRGQSPDRELLRSYFEKIYFENPWYDPEITSVVYDDGRGRIGGFFGVVPRPMRNGERAIRAAIPGNLMVDPDLAGAFASTQLIKACLNGAQDLTVTDTAADASRRVWELCGGTTAALPSLSWFRTIRPCSLAADRFLTRRGRALRLLAAPVCKAVDAALGMTRRGPFRRTDPGCATEELGARELGSQIDALSDHAIVPRYAPEGLQWLLDDASHKRDHGELRKRLVRDADGGAVLGWYVAYMPRGDTSEVLQLGSSTGSIDRVFDCMVADAARHGAHGVFGRLDRRWMHELAGRHCVFRFESWVLVHSREPALVDAFQRGDAFFTGLEGERWMRFVGDPFQ